jgi:hypothetical protein
MQGNHKKASMILRKALKTNPEDESLWLAYDNVVRQEFQAEGSKLLPVLSTPYTSDSTEILLAETGKSTPPQIQKKEVLNQNPQTLAIDFTGNSLDGDFSVIMGQTLEHNPGEGIRFKKGVGGNLVLTFNINRFPQKATVLLTHHLELKKGPLRLIPLLLKVNEKKLLIRRTPVKGRVSQNNWQCTDFLKNGTNIIEIALDSLPTDYILSSVKLEQEK